MMNDVHAFADETSEKEWPAMGQTFKKQCAARRAFNAMVCRAIIRLEYWLDAVEGWWFGDTQ